jgi:pyruvate/2-oxoglutarate dehydrogenase complex dihydrolipoamide dehydrogenase (E3) component
MITASQGQSLVLPDDEHNRALVDQVHPGTWTNPTPAGRYNLVVLGAGTAGLVSAVGAASLGARVAIVERHLTGGDCLNFGCVPSKALISAARVAATTRTAGRFGVTLANDPQVDFTAVMERLRRLRAGLAKNDSVARLAGLGVDVYLGAARFVNKDTVEVGGRQLRFSRAVIATGARSTVPEIPGLAESGFQTSETIFSLTERPRHLLVLGAGPIGCELAQENPRSSGSEAGSRSCSRSPSRDSDSSLSTPSRMEKP